MTAYTERTWRFAGRRVAKGGRLAEAWETESGDVKLFDARKRRFAIGASYRVEAAEDDSVIKAGGTLLESIDDAKRTAWIAEDRAAVAHNDIEKAEAAARRGEWAGLGAMTLDEARRFIGRGPWHTQAARLAVVLKYLGAA